MPWSILGPELCAVRLESAKLDCDVLEVLNVVGVLVILDIRVEAGAVVAGLTSKNMFIKLVRRREALVIIIQAFKKKRPVPLLALKEEEENMSNKQR